MDQGQEQHLASIVNEFKLECEKKYRAGQAEHGGNLYDVPVMSLLDYAIDEAIDQVTYLLTIRQNLRKLTVGKFLSGDTGERKP